MAHRSLCADAEHVSKPEKLVEQFKAELDLARLYLKNLTDALA